MNVLLIRPPAPVPVVEAIEPTPADVRAFSPPWNLLCLQSYLKERTRHVGHLLDCRLYSALEREMVEAVSAVDSPRLAAIDSSTTSLGQTAAVLEILSRRFPHIQRALLGDHPSQFPDRALLPRADFALAGDPEPILRNVLDYLGMEQRLVRVPGLTFRSRPQTEPFWLEHLKSLSPPDWESLFWRSYQVGTPDTAFRATVRLSRGHTGETTDRAFGGRREPLRIWPLDRIARSIQRCVTCGISEVFLTDPPGFWTLDRLNQWCAALAVVRNMQPWSAQWLPAIVTDTIVASLAASKCRRLQFIFPSCDPAVLEQYGCNVGLRDMLYTVEQLRRQGIAAHLRFWIGGPEEEGGEEARILKTIRTLRFCSYSMEPFPFRMDTPLYEELIPQREDELTLERWMEWAWDPWSFERPLPVWGGQPQAAATARIMTRIQHAVLRSPARLVRNAAERVLGRNWIRMMENKAVALLPHFRRRET